MQRFFESSEQKINCEYLDYVINQIGIIYEIEGVN
jgi:hypothetical protein